MANLQALKQKKNHIPSLDNIRGFAVLFVLLIHASYGVVKGGWVGVNLFFVLSGYLITSLLKAEYQATGKISIFKFYVRRVLRLYPALIIGVIIANVLWAQNKGMYPEANQALTTVSSLFYFVNLIPRQLTGSLVHLWSLSVEEHFYFIWPLFTSLILFKLSHRNQITGLILLILFAAAYRISDYHLNFQFKSNLLVIDPDRFTLCSINGILIGALMAVIFTNQAYASYKVSPKTSTWLLALIGCAFLYILLKFNALSFYGNGGFMLIDLLCAVAVFIALKNPTHFLLSNKIIQWLGTRSYSIYVYHYPIFAVFEPLRHPGLVNLLLVTALRLAVSFALAELSYRYVEQPILRLKNRFKIVKPIEPALN